VHDEKKCIVNALNAIKKPRIILKKFEVHHSTKKEKYEGQ